MARLKGGKVLFDLVKQDLSQNFEIDLDVNTTIAIMQKGLSILITDIISHQHICVELVIESIQDGTITYSKITDDNGHEHVFTLAFDYLSETIVDGRILHKINE